MPHDPETNFTRQWIAVAIVAIVLFVVVFTSGCASGMLANRVVCTLDGRGAQVISQWGPFGVASALSDSDITAICQRIREPIAPPLAPKTNEAPASGAASSFKGWT